MQKRKSFSTAVILIMLSVSPTLVWADDNRGNDTGFTVWGVFINNPGYCAAAPCTEAEAFADENPAGTDVCFVTGGRAQANGRATFGGHFTEGSNFQCIYSQLGLVSAEDSEIHFVLQRHGKIRNSIRTDQVTEFLGGCPPNDCLDVHYAIHVASGDHETVSNVYRFKNDSMVRRASSTLRRTPGGGFKVAIDTRFNTRRDHYVPPPPP